MSEEAEMWAEYHKEGQEKRKSNEEWSLAFLKDQGIEVKVLNKRSAHYRVGSFDFWPGTGVFYDQRTKVKGRGVKNLSKLL
jgi:hypothetical protein